MVDTIIQTVIITTFQWRLNRAELNKKEMEMITDDIIQEKRPAIRRILDLIHTSEEENSHRKND